MKCRVIKNISKFILVREELYLANVEREVFDEGSSMRLKKHRFDTASIMASDNYLIIPISENLGNTFIYDIDTKVGFKLNESCVYKKESSPYLQLREFNQDFSSFKLKIYDLKSLDYKFICQVSFDQVSHSYVFDPFYFFVNSTNQIHCFHLPTETTLWQFSVSELGAEKVTKILGVFGEVLVVICEYLHPHIDRFTAKKYFGLAVSSGELLWERDSFRYDHQKILFADPGHNWQWNEGETLIHALSETILFSLNTQNGELVTCKFIQPYLHKIDLDGIQSTAIQGNKLYFRGADITIGGFPTAVGIFDMDKQEVIWQHTFQEMAKTGAFIRTMQPKVSGNKIYVHDTEKTLHIIELEEGDL